MPQPPAHLANARRGWLAGLASQAGHLAGGRPGWLATPDDASRLGRLPSLAATSAVSPVKLYPKYYL